MFIIVNDEKITYSNNLKKLNKRMKTSFKREDFKKYNHDFILKLTDDDLTYQKDLNAMDNVFVNKLFKKDNTKLIIIGCSIVLMIMLLITITSITGIQDMLMQLVNALNNK